MTEGDNGNGNGDNGGRAPRVPSLPDVALIGGVPWTEEDLEIIYALEPKQAEFFEMWIRAGRTEAYRRVFGEPDRAKALQRAGKLMQGNGLHYLTERWRVLVRQQFEINTQKILGSYAKLAWIDTRGFFTPEGHLKPIHELSADQAAMIQSFEIDGVKVDGRVVGHVAKVKLINRKEVLDSLARTQGLFMDRVFTDSTEWYVQGVNHPKSKEEWLEKNKPTTH